ncbi:MAG TPA: hypothetical protein VM266_13390 [Solirubrobacteraceae bacterium]|nr:hypothetical protein [Solirubrobacteraceae bacterium]
MDARTAPSPQRSRLAARTTAILALLMCAMAVYVVVFDASSAPPAEAAGAATSQLERLQGANARLSRALAGLRTGVSARPVRDAVHAAMREQKAVSKWVRSANADGRLEPDVRLDNALQANFEYLDAVGSLLANPRSRLRGELPERARRAEAAFGALPAPAGLPATVRGWERLEAYAKARLS